MRSIKVEEIAYQWEPVIVDENEEYFFPEEISPYMRKRYKHPAVYRWNIFKNEPDDEKLIYIGETQKLCPQRINGYLHPGPSQQTNKRIHKKFRDYLKKGFKIRLEFLRFDEIKIGDFTFTSDVLDDKHFRRFVEELMIVIFRQEGYKIENL